MIPIEFHIEIPIEISIESLNSRLPPLEFPVEPGSLGTPPTVDSMIEFQSAL